MFAYLDGRMVGHLSAYVHTNNTALFRALGVDAEYRQRGIGSALYEAFRAEHPDLLVDLGPVGWRVRPWWEHYCATAVEDAGHGML
jgi:GNAT superfamily N-acetyltransferase